ANAQGSTWLIAQSTPALARGGSGDVLTGLMGGLVAQSNLVAEQNAEQNLLDSVAAAAWWHAQAGIKAAQERTELGVDGTTLAEYLTPTINQLLNEK
ncbi:MAG: NAD(P)H-hydrate dehydratase, partial [Cyanobacteria bacterium J06648_1]